MAPEVRFVQLKIQIWTTGVKCQSVGRKRYLLDVTGNERCINQNKLEPSFSPLQVISSQCALDTVVMVTPLSGRLLRGKAPAMMESYYNFQPSGIGMMRNDVFFFCNYMDLLDLLLLLTNWPAARTFLLPFGANLLLLERAKTGNITD